MPNFRNKKTVFMIGGGILLILILLVIFLGVRGGGGNGTATTTPNDPFGNLGNGGTRPVPNPNENNGVGNEDNTPTTTPSEKAQLIQITTTPVAGFTTFKSADVTFARFIDRATGHVFETGLQSVSPVRVSNVTIPRLQNTEWQKDSILFQYLRDDGQTVRSFFGSLVKNSNPDALADTITGYFIEDRSIGAAMRPDGNAVFSLSRSDDGSSGAVTDRATRARSVVFGSPLSEWLVEWPTSTTIALTTKPDTDAAGLLMYLDPKTGDSRRILIARTLSTLVSPSTSYVLYSHIESKTPGNQRLTLSLLNHDTGETKQLPIVTLPEKCVWSTLQQTVVYCFVPRTVPSGDEQRDWYLGKIALSDNLWKIDTATNAVSILAIPSIDSRTDIDAVKPRFSEDESYILFENKKDDALFAYRLPKAPLQ